MIGRKRTTVTYLVGGRNIKVPQPIPFEGSYKNSRGRPVLNTEGAQRQKSQATMIFGDQKFLPSVCWCKTEFVGVMQREIVEGLTRSCGRTRCVNPDGETQVGYAISNTMAVLPYLVVDGQSTGRYVYDHKPNYEDLYSAPRRWMPRSTIRTEPVRTKETPRRIRANKKVTPKDKRELRRDFTLQLFMQGKHPMFIAKKLLVSLTTVQEDIKWLHKKGLL